MQTLVKIWKGVTFSDNWKNANTSLFDDLAPSWYKRRSQIKNNATEYDDFLTRMKRQHAIETGVIEKLYDLKEGITQTFIKEGFVESFIQHGDTNINETQLMDYLNDQFEAVQFVFDVVSDEEPSRERPLTKGFILELHALLTRHQEFCDAKDGLGREFKTKLIKGAFKKLENNPQHEDGLKYQYCPPEQVDSEIENLLSKYYSLLEIKTNPIILATWFHHAFTTIHPFQDGNGRMARLLASLILIKEGLFPLTVKREDKKNYIDGLIKADNDEVEPSILFFCETQKRSIEAALNLKINDNLAQASLKEVANIFAKKVNGLKETTYQERQKNLTQNRDLIFKNSQDILSKVLIALRSQISIEIADLRLESALPGNEKKYYWYKHQIIDLANKYNYYFNSNLPRGWFCFNVKLSETLSYGLIITIHHYGYDDMTLAIGGILETFEKKPDEEIIKSYATINLSPYTLSLENETIDKISTNLETHLQQLVTLGFAEIINEIE